nr:MAG TPA: hypothetical protein [Caudoviricetes sp.]
MCLALQIQHRYKCFLYKCSPLYFWNCLQITCHLYNLLLLNL